MAYTEVKSRNGNKYYYRVKSVRHGSKYAKERIYLGVNITKEIIAKFEREADKKLSKTSKVKGIDYIGPKIVKIMKNRGIKKAGIFGSYARGEQKSTSDIDILIEPTSEMGYFEVSNLEEELKKSLKKKIDLLTYASINQLLKNRILKEEVRIIWKKIR